jgi:4-amino-4-deoxy-L-arabinose transferase-like glycosyltransferase
MNQVKPSESIFQHPLLRRITLIGILLLALGIRLMDLTDLPLDFHPARQLYSAKRARGMYFQTTTDIPEWQRSIAIEQWRETPSIEPAILERLVSFTYRLTGPELWVARIYSILFWSIGGMALYLLASRLSTPDGGILALAFYLFVPFGVIASRSFQPDPLMVALFIWLLWALERWNRLRTWKSAVLAGLFGGFAVLVKTTALFFVAGALLGIVFGNDGLRRSLRNLQVWVILFLVLFPTGIYYFYGLFIEGVLWQQVGGRFAASLLTDPLFYLNWAGKIDQVVGYIAFALAVLGLFFFAPGRARGLVTGAWVGYLLYGLIFNYHNATHDYYQLPLVPVVALSLSPLIHPLSSKLLETWKKGVLPRIVVILLLAFNLLMFGWEARRELRRIDYRPQAEFWASIGEQLDHRSSVIGLTGDYGASLEYWGWTSITSWPSSGDAAYQETFGGTAEAFLDEFTELTAGKRLFLVTDFDEFDRQGELKAFLQTNYPIFVEGAGYIIFDLEPQP